MGANCSWLDWDYNKYNQAWGESAFNPPYTSVQAKRDKNWCEPSTATIYAPALPAPGGRFAQTYSPAISVLAQPIRTSTVSKRKYG